MELDEEMPHGSSFPRGASSAGPGGCSVHTLGGDTAQPPSLPHDIRQHLINHVLIISLLLVSIGEHPNLYCLWSPRNAGLVDPARSQES